MCDRLPVVALGRPVPDLRHHEDFRLASHCIILGEWAEHVCRLPSGLARLTPHEAEPRPCVQLKSGRRAPVTAKFS